MLVYGHYFGVLVSKFTWSVQGHYITLSITTLVGEVVGMQLVRFVMWLSSSH